jgi:hypothetical protein
MKKLMHVALIASLFAVPALASADDTPDGGQQPWPHPQAIAACKDKSEGATCSFEGHHGTVTGACHKVPSGELACLHPHHHQLNSARGP